MKAVEQREGERASSWVVTAVFLYSSSSPVLCLPWEGARSGAEQSERSSPRKCAPLFLCVCVSVCVRERELERQIELGKGEGRRKRRWSEKEREERKTEKRESLSERMVEREEMRWSERALDAGEQRERYTLQQRPLMLKVRIIPLRGHWNCNKGQVTLWLYRVNVK